MASAYKKGLIGTETIQSLSGLITRSFQGNYVVNPDGSGTLKASPGSCAYRR